MERNGQENKDEKNKINISLISTLNISASIASLAGFLIMIADKFNNNLDWGTVIGYIALSLWIIGSLCLVLHLYWYFIKYAQKQKRMWIWGAAFIFAIAELYLFIIIFRFGIKIVLPLFKILVNS